MTPEFLKQSEIFAFLAAFFLIAIILQQKEHQENPPIIRLSEKDESFRFELGSPEVPPRFREAIQKEIIPHLEELSRKCQCDAIEVVGHTDGVRIQQPVSNLDDKLLGAFLTNEIETLHPGSNIDLGMMRALAIISVLKESQNAGQLKQISFFLPYSAGQMILPDQHLAEADIKAPDRARRRIEIRLLKSSTRRIEEVGK